MKIKIMARVKTVRGIRNCNPGNIRLSSQRFVGEVLPSKDASFKQFRSMEYGLRGLMKILLTYYNVHHLDTVQAIISRYAPQSENDTSKYVDYVCSHLQVMPLDKIIVPTCIFPLVVAICDYESGVRPASETLKKAYLLI